ncbi:hypothetical protein PIB30_092194 [Stylosanthes scabra]|uniref:Uncharacterized protein n=1 Tax=Stylosanthes scabra TaxID=79078 RepID=A0ABU6RVG8_9FABA|nr:hypothetical protein [Stylosanthes scabra]
MIVEGFFKKQRLDRDVGDMDRNHSQQQQNTAEHDRGGITFRPRWFNNGDNIPIIIPDNGDTNDNTKGHDTCVDGAIKWRPTKSFTRKSSAIQGAVAAGFNKGWTPSASFLGRRYPTGTNYPNLEAGMC